MKSARPLAIAILSAGIWLPGSARSQTSAAPPLSLAPPSSEQARATTKNSISPAKPNGARSSATKDAVPPADKLSSAPPVGKPSPSPNPAIDYDGFSIGAVDDNDASVQATHPVRSRTAKGSGQLEPNSIAGQQSADPEDEALKRKLTICRDCK